MPSNVAFPVVFLSDFLSVEAVEVALLFSFDVLLSLITFQWDGFAGHPMRDLVGLPSHML